MGAVVSFNHILMSLEMLKFLYLLLSYITECWYGVLLLLVREMAAHYNYYIKQGKPP